MGDEQAELRCWKLFALTLMMLLHKTRGIGSVVDFPSAAAVEPGFEGATPHY